MPYPNVGEWEYDLGGRDYFILWKHKKSGQTVEIAPNEEQDQASSFSPDTQEWEIQWYDDKGNANYMGYGNEAQVWKKARWFMERYPEGLPDKERRDPVAMNRMQQEMDALVAKKVRATASRSIPRKKGYASRRPRLSR